MLGRTDSRRRALAMLATFVVLAASLGVRLTYWQVVRHDELAAMAIEGTISTITRPAHRGSIYDRTGTVVLASSVTRDQLIGHPGTLDAERRVVVADHLVVLLGLSGDVADTLRARMATDTGYVVLARGLTPEQSATIRAASAGNSPALSGVSLEPQDDRDYLPGGAPGTSLASQVIGFVNRDGLGQYGVEQYYQSTLAGAARVVTAESDAAGNPITDTMTVVSAGAAGADLSLTIDASLQLAVEQELLAAWIADRALRVSAVVLDPYTGEVYASAGYPAYDANDYPTVATNNPSLFIDPVVARLYEPGSVFKLLTAAAVLGNGSVSLTTPINDPGKLVLDGGDAQVTDADLKPMANMTFQKGVAYSRNVVAATAALRLAGSTSASSSILFDTWKRLGIGSRTGIDVANEAVGLVNDPSVQPWRQIDLANGSFGQGVAVTPIQLAAAYAAMVNGGTLVEPRVVRAIGSADTPAVGRWQALTPAVSSSLTGLLHYVIQTNPVYTARTVIPGYDVGGKTGTAQIWDAQAQAWKNDKFNYSFVGYIGRTTGHPDLVISVRVEEGTPTVFRQGAIQMPVMSYELFRRIAHDAISTTDLIPDGAAVPPVASTGP